MRARRPYRTNRNRMLRRPRLTPPMTRQPSMWARLPSVPRKLPPPPAWQQLVEGRSSQQSASPSRMCAVTGFLGAWFIAFLRFFLPRTLFEPPTVFKIGYPSDYALGVDTKWQQKYRIWVDRTPDRVFVIYARCTHLGCTPDWKSSEKQIQVPLSRQRL